MCFRRATRQDREISGGNPRLSTIAMPDTHDGITSAARTALLAVPCASPMPHHLEHLTSKFFVWAVLSRLFPGPASPDHPHEIPLT
jgi:hypothetical protein